MLHGISGELLELTVLVQPVSMGRDNSCPSRPDRLNRPHQRRIRINGAGRYGLSRYAFEYAGW